MEKTRTAIAGVGFIGAAHIEALRRLGFVDIVAVCDSHGAEALAASHYIPRAYDDYKRMIDSEKPDVLHICTPNSTHFEIAKYALERGVSVMCEKPLAFTAGEAAEMTRLAAEKGLLNGVNFHSRYYPMIRQMREMIGKNDLGEIISVHGGYFQDWLLLDTDYSWRLESGQSGSSRAVADIGSHWVDSVEFATGLRIKKVFADFAIFHKTRKKPMSKVDTFSNKLSQAGEYEEFTVDTEDFAQVLMEFDNGARGNMTVTQMYAGRKNQMIVSIAGMKGALHFDSEALNELWLGRRDGYNGSVVKDPAILEPGARSTVSYPGGHVEGFPDAFTSAFRAFYRQLREGQTGEFAAFSDGLREMLICESIVKSAREGRWVEVPDGR